MRSFFHVSVWFILTFMAMAHLKAQCFECTMTNPTNGNNIPADAKVCITSNVTWNDVTVGNNVRICIAEGATLTIQNNFNTNSNHFLNLDVVGNLRFGQKPNFKSNLLLTVRSTGKLVVGTETNPSDIEFNGLQSNIYNNGKIITNVLGFLNNQSINEIENSSNGELDIRANININGTTVFENFGDINISNSYNNNSTSTYINCGVINANTGFNLGGGKIVNSGEFNHGTGQMDLTGTSRLENYGTLTSLGTINGSSNGTLLNHGLMKITTIQPNGMQMSGPSHSDKLGYFQIVNAINPNGAKVGPNLNFTKYQPGFHLKSTNQNPSQIFANNPIYVNATGQSSTAELANVVFDCEANGSCSAALNLSSNCEAEEAPNLCTRRPTGGTPDGFTTVGINTYKSVKSNWPQSEPNGFIALESANKGFVITRVEHVSFEPTNTDSIAPENLVEGMLVYDIQDECIKLFNGINWKCINKCVTL